MDASLPCPGCEGPLFWQAARETRLGRCRRSECRGTWFEMGQLDVVARRPVSVELFEGSTTRRCPSCRITLSTAMLPGAIPVETCSACLGVYLDEGELQELAGTRLEGELDARGAQPNTFVCTKCGKPFPMSEGNLLRSGLACRGCTPQTQNTEWERTHRIHERPYGSSSITGSDDDLLRSLSSLFDDL